MKKFKMLSKSDYMIIFFKLIEAIISVIIPFIIALAVNFLVDKNAKYFLISIVIQVAVYITYIVYSYFLTKLSTKVLETNMVILKDKIAKKVINQNISSLEDKGKYLSWLLNDTETIKSLYYENVYSLFYNIFLFSFSCIAVFIVNPYLLLGIVIITFLIIYLPKNYTKKINESNLEFSKFKETYISKLLNLYKNMHIFYINNLKSKNLHLISTNIDEIFAKGNEINRIKSNYALFIDTLKSLSLFAVDVITLILILQSKITIGILFSIGNVYSKALASLQNVSVNILNINSGIKIFEKLDLEIKETKEEKNKKIDEILEIEYKNVTVKRNDNIIIENFNKIFEKGKKYAVIGESGVGKSTLLNLLLGYAPDYMGTILVNGIDIKEISSESLFSNISYVNSDNIVFLTDILNNINLYGSIDSENIEKIIEELKLTDIEKDKIIDENNISTGQKQRINLARMLLSDKQVIILDEATANVDKDNRERIENKILSNKEKTVIMITHHLDESLRAKFDEVIEMK